MTKDSDRFSDLLTEGIVAIQDAESKEKRKNIREIENELADAIKRKPSTIEWFRKGHYPTARFETEELARTIFVRGHMGMNWLEHFLKSARHPNWESLRDELISFVVKPNDGVSSLYKRTKMIIDRQISLDGTTSSVHEIEVEATSENPLSTIRHRVLSSSVQIQDFRLKLQEFHRDDEGMIKANISTKNENIYTWAIEFIPPLSKGKRASYSYVSLYKGAIALTAEDVRKSILEGTSSNDFENWRVTISAPTDELRMQLSFPPNYRISLPATGGFGVYQGLNDVLDEKTTIILANGFSARFVRESQQWILTLIVHNAKLGYGYELQWHPPSKSQANLSAE